MRTIALVTLAAGLLSGAAAAQVPAPQPPAPKAATPATAQPAAAPKPGTPPATAQPAAAAKPAPPPATAQPAVAAKPATPPANAAAPAAPAPAAPPAEAYSYHAEGRRDPFQTLVGFGNTAAATSRKGEGAAGLAVGEISVHGVMQSRGSLVAMIMGPEKKTYIVHPGDKLLDGTIKAITPQGLVVVQEVNDPLSLVKQREIRKLLRSLEDAKE
jgi:Tfp pilus assembly protein PilP